MTRSELLAVTAPLLAALLGIWVVMALGRTPIQPAREEALHDSAYVKVQICFRVFLGAVLAAVVLGALFYLLGSDLQSAVERSPPWALISGVAAAPALIMLWRWRTVQRAKDQQQKERELAHQAQVAMSSRFADAVRLLSGENFNSLGGVYALERVAHDAPDTYRSVVVKTLCAYVRSKPAAGQLSEDVYQSLLAATRIRDKWEPLDFTGAFLEGADFTKVDLHYTRFSKALLERAIFKNANLQRSNLNEAKLADANLDDADLKSARLHNADLREAGLRGSNLTDADFRAAELSGADLDGATVSGTKFRRAKYNPNTTPPDPSFDFVQHGMRKSHSPHPADPSG